MSQRKRYTRQFKEEAIRLVNQEGVSLTQVARDLGPSSGPSPTRRAGQSRHH